MDMNTIDDSRIKKKATQNRAGYSAPPAGLSGADLSAWLESQHKLWQDELAAANRIVVSKTRVEFVFMRQWWAVGKKGTRGGASKHPTDCLDL